MEWSIWIWPVIATIVGLIQLGLWWADQDLCLTAAQHGLDSGRSLNATPDDARTAASRLLEQGGWMARDPHVSTTGTTTTTMRVEVSVTVVSLLPIPGLTWRISHVEIGVRERFTDPSDTTNSGR